MRLRIKVAVDLRPNFTLRHVVGVALAANPSSSWNHLVHLTLTHPQPASFFCDCIHCQLQFTTHCSHPPPHFSLFSFEGGRVTHGRKSQVIILRGTREGVPGGREGKKGHWTLARRRSQRAHAPEAQGTYGTKTARRCIDDILETKKKFFFLLL